jgi:uncharacterized protein YacL
MLKGITLRIFSAATFGLLLGLLAARLLLASDVLAYQPAQMRWIMSVIVYGVLAYFGMMLAIRGNRDEFSMIIPYVRFQRTAMEDVPLLIDTNIIIDGRLPEICATGFLSTSLIVPRFVLDELQRLGDSHEPLKRERGRRGLETLNQMQKTPELTVTIHETATDAETPVDTKLIQLAKVLQARVLSNDVNLCKIARLQSVVALNLNEIARALRPVLAAGDVLELALVKEGRDAHQAVGYLADGTMIIVNHARTQIGKTVPVTIGGAVQTAAGRLFFADLKA